MQFFASACQKIPRRAIQKGKDMAAQQEGWKMRKKNIIVIIIIIITLIASSDSDASSFATFLRRHHGGRAWVESWNVLVAPMFGVWSGMQDNRLGPEPWSSIIDVE
jgi:hypothetical protein